MSEKHQNPSADPRNTSSSDESNESGSRSSQLLTLPNHVAGSGTLDHLIETARDYAENAAPENTLKAYAKDWALLPAGVG